MLQVYNTVPTYAVLATRKVVGRAFCPVNLLHAYHSMHGFTATRAIKVVTVRTAMFSGLFLSIGAGSQGSRHQRPIVMRATTES